MRVAIDWGTTNRRGYLLDDAGRCIRESEDGQGMLAARGRFAEALHDMFAALAAPPDSAVLLSGMVGAAQGWVHVPYLSTDVPLERIGEHLTQVDVPGTGPVWVVPGMRFEAGSRVDVMRGEETQLLGAVVRGLRNGWCVLPGTHAKWVRLVDGRVDEFWTFMSGELFNLVTSHGTLAVLGQARSPDDGAFDAGLAAARTEPVTQALFGCRAQVVGGELPPGHVASRVSGVLIGAEFAAMASRVRQRDDVVHIIGSPSLAPRYAHAAQSFELRSVRLDARDVLLAAAHRLLSRPASPAGPAAHPMP